jgi:hypothetical protein
MEFERLPVVFTDKLVQFFNYEFIKHLRETSQSFKNMIDEIKTKSGFIKSSKIVFDFDNYTYDSFNLWIEFMEKTQIDVIELINFKYCNDDQMEKLKSLINSNVNKLIINKFNDCSKHLIVFLHELKVDVVQFQDCHSKFIYRKDDFYWSISTFIQRIYNNCQLETTCLMFMDCKNIFINTILNSEIFLPITSKIAIETNELIESINKNLNCHCLSLKQIRYEFIQETMGEVIEYICEFKN